MATAIQVSIDARLAVRDLARAAIMRPEGLTREMAGAIVGFGWRQALDDLLWLAEDTGKLIRVRSLAVVGGEFVGEWRWQAWDRGRKIGGGA